jgi:transcriptional regulator with XRE-family HTH domain
MAPGTDHNRFGLYLQQIRKSRKAGIAPTARVAGLHRSTLHRWEKGESLPCLSELEAVLTALEATSQQKRQALALMDAPRAQAQVRQRINRIAEHLDIETLPHGGDLLRAMRIRRGWTLEDAASRISVSARTLRRWEQGSIWPPLPQLHTLCFVFKAEEEEMIALTCGHLRFTHSREPADRLLTPEALEHRLWAIDAYREHGTYKLLELELLSLKRQAWRLAPHQARGRYLLALAHYIHARHHHAWGSVQESGRLANLAMWPLAETVEGEPYALYAAVIAARVANYEGMRPSPQRAVEILRPWLPLKRWKAHAGWARSEMAAFLCQCGNVDAGLAMSEEALQIASEMDPIYQMRRHLSHVDIVLLFAHKPAQALEFVSTTGVNTRIYKIEANMKKAEILIALDEFSEARNCLSAIYRLMGDDSVDILQPRIAALAQQL